MTSMTDSNGTAISFGERLKRLRQEKGWSQAKLAENLSVHQKQISSYERGLHFPQTELLIRIASLFNTSLDFLAFDDRDDIKQMKIADRDLLQKMEAVDQLPEEDKTIIKGVLDSFILKSQFQQLVNSPTS